MRPFTLAVAAALSIAAAAAHADSEVRTMPAFTAISVQGPISVTVDAGKAQSLTVRGDARFIKELTSEVVNGELRLHMRNKSYSTKDGDQRIVITMPELRALEVEGAGEIKLNRIRGERLDVNYRGAGSMGINGEVKSFKMQAEGVGEVDTRALVANDVDVRFRGIGDVKVYARNRLDAVVQGMGSLTYYGKPATVNKSVGGIGSVKAGD
jgi:Putative auto-transporter adhesin, head GIN domain